VSTAFAVSAGIEGERECLLYLRDITGVKVIKNLILPSERKYTQIDLVALCNTGVWILEVKNRSGKIEGAIDAKSWLQTQANGVKHRFDNPILKNQKRFEKLGSMLGFWQHIYPLVVLVGQYETNIVSEYMVSGVQLIRRMKSANHVFDDNQVSFLYNMIMGIHERYKYLQRGREYL
jgi:Holliday junction resolvase-like predicted endonuclease